VYTYNEIPYFRRIMQLSVYNYSFIGLRSIAGKNFRLFETT